MAKTPLKDTYIWTATPKALQNYVSTLRKNYYDKDNQVMVNLLLKEFYNRLLLKIDALTQEIVLPLGIYETFFNNLIPNIRKLFISEGVKPPQILLMETNHKGN